MYAQRLNIFVVFVYENNTFDDLSPFFLLLMLFLGDNTFPQGDRILPTLPTWVPCVPTILWRSPSMTLARFGRSTRHHGRFVK